MVRKIGDFADEKGLHVDKDFLTIDELSKYLGMKRSTLYQKVERREIPFYRFGRMIRFKRTDIELWIEGFRNEPTDSDHEAKRLIRSIDRDTAEIGHIVKKNIDEVVGLKYTPNYGKPDQIKGLRKEVKNGDL